MKKKKIMMKIARVWHHGESSLMNSEITPGEEGAEK